MKQPNRNRVRQGNYKSFLRNGIILSLAIVMLCILMPEWGAAQVIVIVLLAILDAFQWVLFFYMRR